MSSGKRFHNQDIHMRRLATTMAIDLAQEYEKKCITCSAWQKLSDSPRYHNCGYCARYGLKTLLNEKCHSWDPILMVRHQ